MAIDSVTIPAGIKTSHTWHEIGAIFRIIEKYNIDLFVELGTYQGGLTSLLDFRSEYVKDFNYISIEIDSGMVDLRVLMNLDIFIMDCFSPDTIQMIKNMIDESERALVYCDNENKIEEARVYSPLLRSGDLLLIHDYYNGREVIGIPDYGKIDFPKPEVSLHDVHSFLWRDFYYIEDLEDELLDGTRILGAKRV